MIDKISKFVDELIDDDYVADESETSYGYRIEYKRKPNEDEFYDDFNLITQYIEIIDEVNNKHELFALKYSRIM